MARVYLETSFISACVTTRTSLRSLYEREVSLFWWRGAAGNHELFSSEIVFAELSSPSYPRREQAVRFLAGIPQIEITDAMLEFAAVLVERFVMPRPVVGDALHVAAATVSGMDYLLTWNTKHLANPNKTLHIHAVCADYGYIAPKLVRPDDLREIAP